MLGSFLGLWLNYRVGPSILYPFKQRLCILLSGQVEIPRLTLPYLSRIEHKASNYTSFIFHESFRKPCISP